MTSLGSGTGDCGAIAGIGFGNSMPILLNVVASQSWICSRDGAAAGTGAGFGSLSRRKTDGNKARFRGGVRATTAASFASATGVGDSGFAGDGSVRAGTTAGDFGGAG